MHGEKGPLWTKGTSQLLSADPKAYNSFYDMQVINGVIKQSSWQVYPWM